MSPYPKLPVKLNKCPK